MSWLDLARTEESEEIDKPGNPPEEIARSMADVARSNRLFGGASAVVTHVARLLRPVPVGAPVRILDIGTGSADIPRALRGWGSRRGLDLTVVGVDANPAMLRMARQSCCPPFLVQADALALPFPPHSFDIALCALSFHHFGFDASVRVLTAMDRLATRGFVVTDLRRDLPTLLGVRAALALIGAHPYTRHDGPASVRRAFTPREYGKMIALSGVQGVRVSSHWYYRLALVQEKGEKP